MVKKWLGLELVHVLIIRRSCHDELKFYEIVVPSDQKIVRDHSNTTKQF